MENKRLTAIKISAVDIISGNYYKQKGFEPDFILTRTGMKVSRVRILGTIVNKYVSDDKQFSSLTLDDATATIRVKSFNKPSFFSSIALGDIVDVIGKVRLYNNEIYIVAEIVHKIDDPNMEILRKLELKLQNKQWNEKKQKLLALRRQTSDLSELKQAAAKQLYMDNDVVEAVISSISEEPDYEEQEKTKKETDEKLRKKLLNIISECDKGNGCSYDELVNKSGMDEYTVESAISELLEDGECFEPKPGKIKRL